MCEYPTGVLFNLIKTHILTSEQARRTDSLNVTVRHRLQQGKANQATPCVVPLLEKVPIAPAARVGRWQRRATLQEEQVGWCGVLHIHARRKTPCQAARSPAAVGAGWTQWLGVQGQGCGAAVEERAKG